MSDNSVYDRRLKRVIEEDCCLNCEWMDNISKSLVGKGSADGICIFHPPIYTPTRDFGVYPKVYGTSRCGEFVDSNEDRFLEHYRLEDQ